MPTYAQTLQEEGAQRREDRARFLQENKAALRLYRAEIRKVWFPLTGRRRFNGRDDRLVEQWVGEGLDLRLILRAIDECKGQTLSSLGYIVPRIERLKREEAKARVGEGETGREGEEGDWRAEWKPLLEEMLEDEMISPERRLIIKEFIDALPSLGLEEVQTRIKEL